MTHLSFQVTHWVQYPKDSATVYSYFESRGGKHKDVSWSNEVPEILRGKHTRCCVILFSVMCLCDNQIVFFGLQYFLKRYLAGVVVTKERIDEAEMIYKAHFGVGSSFPHDKVQNICT